MNQQFQSLPAALASAGPVVEFEGRFFITMGRAGFNCTANNRQGFATAAKANAAHLKFAGKGR
jgi:hypothetical protein